MTVTRTTETTQLTAVLHAQFSSFARPLVWCKRRLKSLPSHELTLSFEGFEMTTVKNRGMERRLCRDAVEWIAANLVIDQLQQLLTRIELQTRNAWQSLAYSLLGVLVSPPSEYLWNTPNDWSPQCLTALPPSKRSWTNRGIIIDAGHTNSYVLNSAVTEPNLANFLRGVDKWLPINLLKLKYRYSHQFRNASVPSEWRSSNYGGVASNILQSSFVNSEVTRPMFTKFLHDRL